MVKRIWGTCDGGQILFTQSEAGLWEATVPAHANGEYTVALWAEDAAGNQSYFCTLLLAYDITQMCCAITILDVGTNWTQDDVRVVFANSDVRADETCTNVCIAPELRPVDLDVIRCEICGR